MLGSAIFAACFLTGVQAADVGEVRGRVFSSSSASYLNNARVTIKGTSFEAFTDSSGEYVLARVPTGAVDLTAAFTGLTPEEARIAVEAGKTVRHDFDLASRTTAPKSAGVALLDAFSVEERRLSAQAVALNEQRFAPNIKNVIAADEFGDIGEGNIAEIVKFIPGISADYSANVGIGISIRGFPGSATLITLDGGEVASAAMDPAGAPTRAPGLDALKLNNISRIEITKVPTPDLPANAQGGSVNVISKNGFERRTALLSYRSFLTLNSRSFGTTELRRRTGSRDDLTSRPLQPGFKVSYEIPVNKAFAFTLSGGSVGRLYQYRGVSTPWNLTTNVLSGLTINAQEQLSGATDAALTGEWRIGSANVLRATVLYVETVAYRSLNRMNMDFGAGATGSRDFVQGAAAGVGAASFGNPNTAQVNNKTLQVNLGYAYRRGAWKADVYVFAARSRNGARDLDQGFFNRVDLDLANLVIRGDGLYAGMPKAPLPRQVTAVNRLGQSVDLFNGGIYSISRVLSRQSEGTDGKTGAKADVTREFGHGFTLKTGMAVNLQDRDYREDFRRWDFRPTGTAADRLASNFDLIDPVYSRTAQNYFPGSQVQWPSLEKLYQLFKARPEYFVLNEANSYSGSVTPSKKLQEMITAAYVRGDVKAIDNRLWLVGGVRFEKTDDEGTGPLDEISATFQKDRNGNFLRDSAGNLMPVVGTAFERQKLRFQYRGAHAEKSYYGYYPSVNASFDLRHDLMLRAAYARTIGRPNLGEIIPGQTITDPSLPPERRTITVVNTGLVPWTSDGYDLSLESYHARGGIGTIGVFGKQVKNFFGGVRVPATPALLAQYGIPESFPGEFAGYDIITKQNVGEARINGVEISYKQSLFFLPAWGKNFQVFGNGTSLKLSGSNAADFSRYSPRIYNWGVNFARGKISARMNWHQRPGNRLEPAGTDPTAPKSWSTSRTVVSTEFEYRLTRSLSFYGTANNLTDTPEISTRFGSITPDYARTTGLSVYGTDFTLGLRGTF